MKYAVLETNQSAMLDSLEEGVWYWMGIPRVWSQRSQWKYQMQKTIP